jgi:hypothetical protein
MARVTGLRQMFEKKFTFLEGLSEKMKASFGRLSKSFIMTVWGQSGNGKSNFLMEVLIELMEYGKVLYVSLEEGTEASMCNMIMRHLDLEKHGGKIEFADHEMNYDELVKKLSKKQSPQFIVIDSLQYWDITLDQYKALKEKFKKKTFIFISHAKGKIPDGAVADKVRYDSGVKVRVEGYVAFFQSRYTKDGIGNNPFIIWEDGAKKYWGKKYKSVISGIVPKEKKPTKQQQKIEEDGISEVSD